MISPSERLEAIFYLSDCASSRPDVVATALKALKAYRTEEEILKVLRGYQGGLELHIATQQGFNKLAQALYEAMK